MQLSLLFQLDREGNPFPLIALLLLHKPLLLLNLHQDAQVGLVQELGLGLGLHLARDLGLQQVAGQEQQRERALELLLVLVLQVVLVQVLRVLELLVLGHLHEVQLSKKRSKLCENTLLTIRTIKSFSFTLYSDNFLPSSSIILP